MTAASVYVLEGPDGAGKTYFTSLLGPKEFARTGRRLQYVHNDRPFPATTSRQLYHEYLRQLRAAVANRDLLGITTFIDRSWPSEAIYGQLFRGRSKLSRWQLRRLERYANRHGVIRVALQAGPETRRRRIEARGETWHGNQVLVGIRYRKYFQLNGWTSASSLLADQ